jgi:hypothetical protein
VKRSVGTAIAFILCLAPLRADVTLTQAMTVEGGTAGAAMAGKPMTLVTRIKGSKARMDMDSADGRMSTLVDLSTKEIVVLDHAGKIAQPLGARPAAERGVPDMKVEASSKPTGQSRTIDGTQCDEHALKMSLAMEETAPGQAGGQAKDAPPDLAKQLSEMLKDVRMVLDGSVCATQSGPAAAEYMTFQKAAAEANLSGLLSGMFGNQSSGGTDKVLAALTSVPGLPYLTEMTTTIEGTGPMVAMLKQLAGIKMTQKTTAVSTEPLADDLFKVPPDYVVKK